MRLWTGSAALVALALVVASCSDDGPTSPTTTLAPRSAALQLSATALPAVRVSEFHYDNDGADAGEAIEISGPAGTDLTGWQIVLTTVTTARSTARPI